MRNGVNTEWPTVSIKKRHRANSYWFIFCSKIRLSDLFLKIIFSGYSDFLFSSFLLEIRENLQA